MTPRHPALRPLRTHLLRRAVSAAAVVAAAAMPAWWLGGHWGGPRPPSQGLPATATVAAGGPGLVSVKPAAIPTAGR